MLSRILNRKITLNCGRNIRKINCNSSVNKELQCRCNPENMIQLERNIIFKNSPDEYALLAEDARIARNTCMKIMSIGVLSCFILCELLLQCNERFMRWRLGIEIDTLEEQS